MYKQFRSRVIGQLQPPRHRLTGKTDDNRDAEVELRGGVDDPLGNNVTSHDAAKDVHKNARNLSK